MLIFKGNDPITGDSGSDRICLLVGNICFDIYSDNIFW